MSLLKFMINLTRAAPRPNILAIGTHSLIVSPKNIIIIGMFTPAPPIPPALPKMETMERMNIPKLANIVGGQYKGVKEIEISEDSVKLEVELSEREK